MDAVWHGIEAFFEWIFSVSIPIGRMANIFFISVGFIGVAFWLWYGESARKGGDNFLADNADKKQS